MRLEAIIQPAEVVANAGPGRTSEPLLPQPASSTAHAINASKAVFFFMAAV
jgi:hypothetical protein